MRGWAVGVALSVLLGASGAVAGDGVWLRVEQNGVFGRGEPRVVEVAAVGDELRLRDPGGQRAFYVDRGARQLIEVDTARGEFVRKPFSAYANFRQQRATKRAAQLKRIVALREAAEDDAAREAIDRRLLELGLRLDGKERITKQEGPPQPEYVTLGLALQPVLCTPTTLRVNQARDPVASLQVAPKLTLEVQPLDVYLELGILPEPLEQAVRELEGTVLRGELLLDDGSLKKRIRFRVLEVRSGVDVGSLALPPGLTEVASLGEAEQPARRGACLHCGEPVGKVRVTLNGRAFCSKAHRHAYIKAHAKR